MKIEEAGQIEGLLLFTRKDNVASSSFSSSSHAKASWACHFASSLVNELLPLHALLIVEKAVKQVGAEFERVPTTKR